MIFRSEPFKVRMTGRAGIVYEEGPRSMEIDSEMLAGPDFDIVIYTESIKRWRPPHESEAITDDVKSRIKANLAESLPRLRIDWQERG